MRKQITLALAVVIAVLLGCGLSQNHVRAEQTATDPPPTVAPSSSETDFECGRKPRDKCPEYGNIHGGIGKDKGDSVTAVSGYEMRGSGWFCPDTGEYCVEEGSSISLPDGHLVEGPKKGTYKGQ